MSKKRINDDTVVEISKGDRYLFVSQTGAPRTVDEALGLQETITKAARVAKVDLAILDNRRTIAPSDRVRRSMFDYVNRRGPFRRVALLLESITHRRRFNTKSTQSRVAVRAFDDRVQAASWLLTADEWGQVPLCIFEYGGVAYAVPAERVIEITGPRDIQVMPRSTGRIAGVILHRRTMVPVVVDPEGREGTWKEPPPRFVVCDTHDGYIAIPATVTYFVGNISMHQSFCHGETSDSSAGIVHCVEPYDLAAAVFAERE